MYDVTMTTNEAVYSTSTTGGNRIGALSADAVYELGLDQSSEYRSVADMDSYYEYCFVCSRATDHRAEHDELVQEGKAKYATDVGVVYYNPDGFPLV